MSETYKNSNRFSKTQFNRLLKYLTDLQLSGKCVFFEVHGHVNTFTIDVRADRKHYETNLYSIEFDLPPYEQNFQDYIRNRDWKQFVDEIIEDIDGCFYERDKKLEADKVAREQSRKKYFEELKAEFEPAVTEVGSATPTTERTGSVS